MTEQLHFCMITTFYPPYSFGGDAIYLQRLSTALTKQGHIVDVIHCADSYRMFRPEPPASDTAPIPGLTVHTLRSGWGTLSPLLSHQTGRPLLKKTQIQNILASRRFDVIHYHNISLFGPAVLEVAPPYNDYVKLYTMHEHWLVCPMNVLWKNDEQACETPECVRCTLASRRPPQLWRYGNLRDLSAKHVDQFISPSRFTRDMHHQRGFTLPIEPLPYFLDPVDGDWAHPGTPPHERPYFLFVGRLEKIKGVQTLLPEFSGPGDYDLVICGSGEYEQELKLLARGLDRVRFVGWQSQKQLSAFYAHALGIIVPSITYETFGIIVIEAFARKKPVIVRDLGALPEAVQDSGGGFVYRNREQLLAAMDKLARSPQLRNELGERGYEAFCRCWSTQPHLDRYFQLIQNAARSRYRTAKNKELLTCHTT